MTRVELVSDSSSMRPKKLRQNGLDRNQLGCTVGLPKHGLAHVKRRPPVPPPTKSATANAADMGRVRTKTVKKSSRQVIERYYSRMTLDFHTNKKMLDEVAIIPTKRLRNKIAGFSTHLMRRIQRGPVRGISLKLQEEERERRMDFVPDESAIKVDHIEVDKDTVDMLASLGMTDIPGVEQQADAPTAPTYPYQSRPGGGYGAGRRN
ncbi:hypothetical protein BHE74_00048339 [Ensete ventricosum]|nr:hypothetical protein BHE74_00048339 [Ensete ventricosum]